MREQTSEGTVTRMNRRVRQLLGAAAISGLASGAALATSTYTGGGSTSTPTSGDWNTAGHWSPSGIPASSSSTEIDLLGSNTYTSTDDISGAFSLNILKVAGNASVLAANSSSSILFNGSSATLTQTAGSLFTISAPVALNANTAVSQVAGGEIDFTGAVTTANSSALNLSNSTGSGNSTVKFTGANTFNGLAVNANVTAIAGQSSSTSTLGSGTVTLNGGSLQLQGQQQTGTVATQQIIALPNSDFTRDIVFENATGSSISAGGIDGSDAFYETGFNGGSLGLPTTASGRTFQSSTSSPLGNVGTGNKPIFQLQPYNGNNALLVNSTTTTLNLATPTVFTRVEFAYTGSITANPVSVSFNFADGNTSTGTYSWTPQDWYSTQSFTALHAGYSNGGSPQPYGNISEVDFNLTGTDATQAISSINFSPGGNLGTAPKGLDLMAMSGIAFSTGLASSQTYGNNVAVTADSSINVTGSLMATMGNLSIGANKLSVGSSDTSGQPYSLTLGTVTLTGNGTGASTFDVANSSSGGLATLTLGAFNDGGVAQTVTFNPTGLGTIILSSAATSLTTGTVLNVNGGIVNATAAGALGSTATVNVLPGATLSLGAGANETVSALNGSGGTVAIGGNILTIGSTDNLNSTFGGLITGSGSITKAGTGTLTLSGSNTFGGNNTNSNGEQIPTSVTITGGTVVAAGASNISNGAIASGPLGTASVLVNAGTSLFLDSTPGRVLGNPLYATSSGSAPSTIGALNTTGVSTFSGNLTLGTGSSGDNSHSVVLGATAGGEVDFTGNILANSTTNQSKVTVSNLTGSGSATVRFTGSNTYNGGTVINPNVTLAIGPSIYNNGLGTNTVTLAGGRLALSGVYPTGSQQTVPVTGYNADTIIDQNAANATQSSTGTLTSTIDGSSLYYESGYQGTTSNALPNGGAITSQTTGHLFQLAPYTGENTLRFGSTGTQTLSLTTPGIFSTLDFLAVSQSTASFSVTLNFADSTSATIGGFSTADWYGGRSSNNAVTGLNPAQRLNNGAPSTAIENFGGALTLQEYDLIVPAADQSKTVSSITFNATAVNGASAEIYAVSGATAAGTTPQATQSYSNNVVLSADSTIDVSGSLNASVGTLTIGGQALSVTSSDTSASPYSLTTGQVNFAGSTPTFNVSNSVSNGAGTLILGPLNDTGAAQHLTKYGSGTLALNSPAVQVSFPSTYNIAGGTLAANDPAALSSGGGTPVAIAVANGATFSLGANQTIDALNDYGSSPVVNGASVVLNGNTLTVGDVHDQNSSFSGVISDGTGGAGSLVKSGGGTTTLYGASTYSGPTTVGFGTLIVANTTGSATGSGDVTLANTSNATLASGTVGSISGNVSAGQTSFIQPGGNGSIGTLSVGGLTTGFHTDINFDLGSGSGPVVSNGDLINIGSGTVNISPATLLTLGSATPSTPGVDYRLFGGAGVSNLNTSSFILPTAPSGVVYSLSASVDPGYLDLVVSSGTVSGITLLWNNSGTNTTPPGDGVSWGNTVAGDTTQNWNSSSGPSGFTSGDAVVFSDNNNGNYNVNLTSNVLPLSVTVTSGGNYNIGSTGGFVIGDSPTGPTSLNQSGGGLLTVSNQNTFTGPTSISGTGTTLHLTDTGTLNTSSIAIASGSTAQIDGVLNNSPSITVSGALKFGASDLNNDPTAGYLVRNLGGLNVASGATVTLSPATTIATRTVLVATSLANVGKIDLSNNDMILRNTSAGALGTAGTIANQLQTGFNNGSLNASSGITSSDVLSNHLTALGYAPGGSTFDGVSTSSSDLLIKYTYFGDATLDGTVNSADYAKIDAGYLAHGSLTGWYNGDFNYDGVINGSDYTLIDNAFNTQGAAFTSELANPAAVATAQIAGGGATSAVPEPASLGLIFIGAAGLLGRRRRHA